MSALHLNSPDDPPHTFEELTESLGKAIDDGNIISLRQRVTYIPRTYSDIQKAVVKEWQEEGLLVIDEIFDSKFLIRFTDAGIERIKILLLPSQLIKLL